MDFNPQTGHEQAGRRPALVVSNDILNHHTSMAMVCPITNTDNKHPLHVPLDDRTRTTGVILCEQVKSLDVRKRNAVTAEKAPTDIVDEARSMIKSFLE
ncbi:type II toxin-antitoxin system PemK/MazF family toxin [Roseburia sp. BX0805]|jgi:mRNA interferase MazF|uniref:Type II toxin-antitoxin system PemK/MazF family toxin n=2 Tax=Roseburia yibonii TaxID=2763063 RepID=A0ABR7IDE8_9FIRM|nr:type II toxin-antitoxin system PemK/MazF family toxin [Roseburia yibonii]